MLGAGALGAAATLGGVRGVMGRAATPAEELAEASRFAEEHGRPVVLTRGVLEAFRREMEPYFLAGLTDSDPEGELQWGPRGGAKEVKQGVTPARVLAAMGGREDIARRLHLRQRGDKTVITGEDGQPVSLTPTQWDGVRFQRLGAAIRREMMVRLNASYRWDLRLYEYSYCPMGWAKSRVTAQAAGLAAILTQLAPPFEAIDPPDDITLAAWNTYALETDFVWAAQKWPYPKGMENVSEARFGVRFPERFAWEPGNAITLA